MIKEQEIIMYDSPQAATKVDMPGWKSRLGHFYPGDNASSEHGARWSGCTHMTCGCGKVFDKGSVRCYSCQAKIDKDKYYALPLVEWDGVTPVCDDSKDKYYFDKGSLMDDMYWILDEANKKGEEPVMYLVLCKPHYLHFLEGSEWEDDLPEDGELSDEVGVALDALNAVLKAQGPSCWFPDNKRIDVDALWTQLKAEKQKEEDAAKAEREQEL